MRLTATLGYIQLSGANSTAKAINHMNKDDKSIFKNNQDKWEIAYLSKHWSCIKLSHIMASLIKLTGLSPFYKIGSICHYVYIYRMFHDFRA